MQCSIFLVSIGLPVAIKARRNTWCTSFVFDTHTTSDKSTFIHFQENPKGKIQVVTKLKLNNFPFLFFTESETNRFSFERKSVQLYQHQQGKTIKTQSDKEKKFLNYLNCRNINWFSISLTSNDIKFLVCVLNIFIQSGTSF